MTSGTRAVADADSEAGTDSEANADGEAAREVPPTPDGKHAKWPRRTLAIVLVGIACVAMVACGDAGNDVAGISSTTSTASSTTIDESMPGTAASIKIASTSLGDVLTTSSGKTLYLNTDDGPNDATCVADCAQTWPPLTTQGAPKGTDVSPDLLGTVERSDGSTQVTAGGHPLYTFSGDSGSGDTNGEGSDGIWFAASPTGKPVKGSPAGY